MPSQKQHAFFAGKRVGVIFQPVILDNIADILSRVTREETEFCKLAAQRNVLSTENTAPIRYGHARKSQCKVLHADAAKASVKEINNQAESDSLCSRQWPGKNTYEFHPNPKCP